VGTVKQKVVAAANQHCGDDAANEISADLLRLLTVTNTVLDNDNETLGECESLKKDGNDVLHVVVKIADDEWEGVDVVSTDMEDAS